MSYTDFSGSGVQTLFILRIFCREKGYFRAHRLVTSVETVSYTHLDVYKRQLVDTVDHTAVNTTRHKLIEFDLNTVTIPDLAFSKNFKVEAKRQDFINGLISWFDIEFPAPKGEKPVTFSTGAHAPYTHWKQTVFYLEDDLEAETGDVLEGRLTCIPNKANNRDLDIKIKYTFKAKGADAKERSKHNENTYLMH